MLTSSWLNLLLICLPVALWMGFANANQIAVFALVRLWGGAGTLGRWAGQARWLEDMQEIACLFCPSQTKLSCSGDVSGGGDAGLAGAPHPHPHTPHPPTLCRTSLPSSPWRCSWVR